MNRFLSAREPRRHASAVLATGCCLSVFIRRAVLVGGWGGWTPPPRKFLTPPPAIKKTQGGRLSMYLCISTVVDFNSQNVDPPNEMWQIQPSLSVCNELALHRNGYTNWAVFFHGGHFWTYRTLRCKEFWALFRNQACVSLEIGILSRTLWSSRNFATVLCCIYDMNHCFSRKVMVANSAAFWKFTARACSQCHFFYQK